MFPDRLFLGKKPGPTGLRLSLTTATLLASVDWMMRQIFLQSDLSSSYTMGI